MEDQLCRPSSELASIGGTCGQDTWERSDRPESELALRLAIRRFYGSRTSGLVPVLATASAMLLATAPATRILTITSA